MPTRPRARGNASPDEQRSNPLILITWNIQYGKGADGRIDFPRIVETARMLGDADVICIQELAVNFPDLDDGAGAD